MGGFTTNITMEINDENIIKEITDAITDLSVEVKQEIAVTALKVYLSKPENVEKVFFEKSSYYSSDLVPNKLLVEILKSGQFSEEMKELQISIVEYLLKDGRYQKIIVNALTSAVLNSLVTNDFKADIQFNIMNQIQDHLKSSHDNY